MLSIFVINIHSTYSIKFFTLIFELNIRRFIRDRNLCIRKWPCFRRQPLVPPLRLTQRPAAMWTAQVYLVEHRRRVDTVPLWLTKFTVSQRNCKRWDIIERTVKSPPEHAQVIKILFLIRVKLYFKINFWKLFDREETIIILITCSLNPWNDEGKVYLECPSMINLGLW